MRWGKPALSSTPGLPPSLLPVVAGQVTWGGGARPQPCSGGVGADRAGTVARR